MPDEPLFQKARAPLLDELESHDQSAVILDIQMQDNILCKHLASIIGEGDYYVSMQGTV